jgi:hypothetical protein
MARVVGGHLLVILIHPVSLLSPSPCARAAIRVAIGLLAWQLRSPQSSSTRLYQKMPDAVFSDCTSIIRQQWALPCASDSVPITAAYPLIAANVNPLSHGRTGYDSSLQRFRLLALSLSNWMHDPPMSMELSDF